MTMTTEQAIARIAALEAQLAAQAANAPKPKGITLKVSEKGAVSVYGLARWPVTLYASQMTKLIQEMPKIAAFMEDNKASLTVKA